MRIISQNGSVDAPYDSSCLFADGVGGIQCKFNGECFRLGLYSSREKAKLVLESIRNVYGIRPGYFQLPKDEEVIVNEQHD